MFSVDVDGDDGGDHTALESFPRVLMSTLEREIVATILMIWFGKDGRFSLMIRAICWNKTMQALQSCAWVDPCLPPS